MLLGRSARSALFLRKNPGSRCCRDDEDEYGDYFFIFFWSQFLPSTKRDTM